MPWSTVRLCAPRRSCGSISTISRSITSISPDTIAVDAKQVAIATYTKTYLGKTSTITSTRATGAGDFAAPTFGVLNTSSNVNRIGFNGSTITGPNFVMSASFNTNNNLCAQKAIGALGAIGVGNGEFTVTGKLQTYFGDAPVYNQT
jgi:hypothetical protein